MGLGVSLMKGYRDRAGDDTGAGTFNCRILPLRHGSRDVGTPDCGFDD